MIFIIWKTKLIKKIKLSYNSKIFKIKIIMKNQFKTKLKTAIKFSKINVTNNYNQIKNKIARNKFIKHRN